MMVSKKTRLFSLLLIVCLFLSACSSNANTDTDTETVTELTYEKGETSALNPYKGFVAWANDDKDRNMEFSLVYVDILWSEIEREEGVYDIAEFEEKYHFAKWRKEGKKAVFRIVLDCPGDDRHTDIPKWLYDLTGDGVYYDVSYGMGYCPDYANPVLIEKHRQLLKALAHRYGKDDFLAYIELGSLGHWGEWHIHEDIGLQLLPGVYETYVNQYLEEFPEKKLLMRRPFKIAEEKGIGLYNDSFAREGETNRFIDWIENGGDYEGVPDALTPMPDAWKSAPIGGEISSSVDRFAALGDAGTLTETLKALHVSFIGPTNWLGKELSAEQLKEEKRIGSALGYDFYVSGVTIRSKGEDRTCDIKIENAGCAPLYYPYDIHIKLTGEEYKEERILQEYDLTALLPENSITISFTLPQEAESLSIALMNNDSDGIYLSNDTERDGFWQKLF